MLRRFVNEAPGSLFALLSMSLFYVLTAISIPLMNEIGANGVTCLRLLGAAGTMWVFARPKLSKYGRRSIAAAVVLGVASFGMSLFYALAVLRTSLGAATAIGFMGPFCVALVGSQGFRQVLLALAAIGGVLLIVFSKSEFRVEEIGVFFAFLAAICWGTYIILTKYIGSVFYGFEGLTISLTAAAVAAIPFGVLDVWERPSITGIIYSVLLGSLMPCASYALEMLALRRMTTRSFGIVMSMDPVISVLVGVVFLGQFLSRLEFLGVLIVSACALVSEYEPNRGHDIERAG